MPPTQLTDDEINKLVTLSKPLPPDYRIRLRTRTRSYSDVHEEASLDVEMSEFGTFRIILRKNKLNPLDFSAILGFIPPERIKLFRLRRYNGTHKHTNKIERESFRSCHIHLATQRYQEAGWDIDGYAQPSNKYSGLESALDILLNECNFIKPENERNQPRMI
jgi:hypothetical protein